MKFFVVVGLGQFGRSVATSLQEGGGDVLAIDQDDRRVEEVKEQVAQAVCTNATDINALRAIGCAKAQTAVVALGEKDLESSILCCAALSDLGVGDITVRAANELHGKILQRMGATRLVYPEKQMGEGIAKSILMSGVIDQVTLSTGQTVAQVHPRSDLVGKTLKDAQLRARYGINVIGIERRKSHIDDNGETVTEVTLESVPDPEDVIDDEDVLIVVGTQAQIELVARKD
jgi:trk system potassium uptake protein TrkA